jgi:S1-C subfamily serine protease
VPLLKLRPVADVGSKQELLFTGPRVRIGRSRDNDLVLPDRDSPSSSSHHAEAHLDPSGAWTIVDSGSTNGTRLNGVPVQRHQLKSGDRLAFGDEQFLVAIDNGKTNLVQRVAAIVLAVGALALSAWLVLRPAAPMTFEGVAAAAAPSLFMIGIDADGQRRMIGSAFAVSADGWLATNAHIADALTRRGAFAGEPEEKIRPVAVQGDTYVVHKIGKAAIHPMWKPGSLAHDVALLRLAGNATTVPLAMTDAGSAALTRGTPIAAFGFPAVSTDPTRPRGRLSADVVGDIRGDYLEVGLGISPGMSGSPVLDRSGSVVAVVVGGDFVEMPDGTARPSGSSANWALSAAAVRELLDSLR